ncbi:MAG: helix-turn-helix domain-containing protein [Polyangiales bacterium]
MVFLCIPPVVPLDLFGPFSVFDGANRLHSQPRYRLEVLSWGDARVETEGGAPLVLAHRPAARVPAALDTLVVVGGTGAVHLDDPALTRWLQRASTRARRTVSICTGAFLLARAGLLRGRTATTHWAYCNDFARAFPDTRVEPDRLWVRDGSVFTSAGVTTGIDLALALVADDLGGEAALTIARMLVVFVQRPGGQAQYSKALHAQQSEIAPIRELCVWLADHLREPHPVTSLAARVGMSPRNFVRVFTREVGVPPAKHVLGLRVEAAQRRLERSDDALAEVAARVGFGSAEVLNRAFGRVLGITPAAYRARFRRTGTAAAQKL